MTTLLLRITLAAKWLLLLALVNAWADREQPWRSHEELAAKIAYVALSSPIFDASIDPLSIGSAAHLTSTVEDESSFGARRRGSNDFGVAQIHARPDLENDDVANLIEASRQIRISFAMCGNYAPYFCGHCTADPRVLWMSARRVSRAKGFMTAADAGEVARVP